MIRLIHFSGIALLAGAGLLAFATSGIQQVQSDQPAYVQLDTATATQNAERVVY